MADTYAMKSGNKFAAEIHHSRTSSSDDAQNVGDKSVNRDEQEMARLGKRQELRVWPWSDPSKVRKIINPQ